jgi:hypothetical protein
MDCQIYKTRSSCFGSFFDHIRKSISDLEIDFLIDDKPTFNRGRSSSKVLDRGLSHFYSC